MIPDYRAVLTDCCCAVFVCLLTCLNAELDRYLAQQYEVLEDDDEVPLNDTDGVVGKASKSSKRQARVSTGSDDEVCSV